MERGRVGRRALPWLLMLLPVLSVVAGAFVALALGKWGPTLLGLAGAVALISLIPLGLGGPHLLARCRRMGVPGGGRLGT